MKAESGLILLLAAAGIRDRDEEENNIFAAFAPKAASAERATLSLSPSLSSLPGAFVHHRIKRARRRRRRRRVLAGCETAGSNSAERIWERLPPPLSLIFLPRFYFAPLNTTKSNDVPF